MTKFWIKQGVWRDSLEVFIGREQPDGGMAIAQPLMMKVVTKQEREVATYFQSPCFTLEKGEAQHLMDRLWDAGLRPSEGSGSAGALLATQKHLDDMRALVFEQLGIEKEIVNKP